MAQRPNNKLQYCLSDTLWRLLRPTPTLQEQRHTVQPPLQAGARATGRGFRVGVVDLLEWGLFGALNFKLSCPSSIGCCGKLVI